MEDPLGGGPGNGSSRLTDRFYCLLRILGSNCLTSDFEDGPDRRPDRSVLHALSLRLTIPLLCRLDLPQD